MQLGELTDFIKPDNLEFTLGGERFEVNPTAAQVLKFHAEYAAARDQDSTVSLARRISLAADLIGATYDADKDEVHGGMVDEWIKLGVTGGLLHRLFETIILYYQYGEKAAEAMYTTGDWDKVLEVLGVKVDDSPK